MAFPTLVPTSRSFEPGNYPVKTYNAQDGTEIRIAYGNRRTNAKLSLSFNNVTDSQAEGFLTHFDAVLGTLNTFSIPSETKSGWTGTSSAIDAPTDAEWRYEQPPQILSVRPGTSSVTVSLLGVI